MTATTSSPYDEIKVGDPNIAEIDFVPEVPCTFTWVETVNEIPYTAVCTREEHGSGQHVAEGTEETGVLAVHPWSE